MHSALGTYGVFVDNTEYTRFDFSGADEPDAVYTFGAPAPVLTFYVLTGPDLPSVVRQYTALTGRMPLPALWTLGYHQCRWGYRTDADFQRLLERCVEPGGRLILGSYGSQSRGTPPLDLPAALAEAGLGAAGTSAGGRDGIARFAWVDRRP